MRNFFRYSVLIVIILFNYLHAYSWDKNVRTSDWVDILLTPNGTRLILADYKKLLIYNINEPLEDTTILFTGRISLLSVSQDSKLLAIKEGSNTVKVINLETLTTKYSIEGIESGELNIVSFFSDDNRELIHYSKISGARCKVNLESGNIAIDTIPMFISISVNAKYSIALKSADSLELWDFQNLKFIKYINLDTILNYMNAASISNDGKYLGYFDTTKSVKILNIYSNEIHSAGRHVYAHDVHFNFSMDNSRFLFLPIDETYDYTSDSIYIFDILKGELKANIIKYIVLNIAYPIGGFSPGKHINSSIDLSIIAYSTVKYTGNKDERRVPRPYIRIANLIGNTTIRIINDGHVGLIYGADLDKQNNILATSGEVTYFWNSITGNPIKVIPQYGIPVFSPDRKYLYLGKSQMLIKIDLNSYLTIDTFYIEDGVIRSLFATEKPEVILCQTDKAFYIFKYPELNVIKKIPYLFSQVKFDPTKENFVALIGNKLQLYNVKTGELIKEKVFDIELLSNCFINDFTTDLSYIAVLENPGSNMYGIYNTTNGFIWDIDKNYKVLGTTGILDLIFYFTPDNKYAYMICKSTLNYGLTVFKACYNLADRKYQYYLNTGAYISTNLMSYYYIKFFDDMKNCIWANDDGSFSFNPTIGSLISEFQENNDIIEGSELTVFPNPVSDIAVIPVSTGFEGSSIEINIYNMLGQKQDLRYEFTPGQENASFTIDCSHLLPGVYYYVIMNGGIKSTGSFVVAR